MWGKVWMVCCPPCSNTAAVWSAVGTTYCRWGDTYIQSRSHTSHPPLPHQIHAPIFIIYSPGSEWVLFVSSLLQTHSPYISPILSIEKPPGLFASIWMSTTPPKANPQIPPPPPTPPSPNASRTYKPPQTPLALSALPCSPPSSKTKISQTTAPS